MWKADKIEKCVIFGGLRSTVFQCCLFVDEYMVIWGEDIDWYGKNLPCKDKYLMQGHFSILSIFCQDVFNY